MSVDVEQSLGQLRRARAELQAVCNRMYGQDNVFAADDLDASLRQLDARIDQLERCIGRYEQVVDLAARSLP
ncbi:hypothetical protein [Halomonas sp. HG01]|uniref:hypothetical protein n=1 Tax=Halomonas sp. HG01 TaxID=1609967 RepID=UPI0006147F5D|nr:hypothetical protein [Halomonas sp. HG01]